MEMEYSISPRKNPPSDMALTSDDVARIYQSVLSRLTRTSENKIGTLTRLAESWSSFSPIIVRTIEQELKAAEPSRKLPILYLIDSISKNVKKDYLQIFAQNIVSNFYSAFHKVDIAHPQSRKALYELRNHWNGLFPQDLLNRIDLKCNSEDGNWPYTPPQTQNDPEKEELRRKVKESEEKQKKLKEELEAAKKANQEKVDKLLKNNSISKDAPESVKIESVLERNPNLKIFREKRLNMDSLPELKITTPKSPFRKIISLKGKKPNQKESGLPQISTIIQNLEDHFQNIGKSPSSSPNQFEESQEPDGKKLRFQNGIHNQEASEQRMSPPQLVDNYLTRMLKTEMKNSHCKEEEIRWVKLDGIDHKVRFKGDTAFVVYKSKQHEIYYDMTPKTQLILSINKESRMRIFFESPVTRRMILKNYDDVISVHWVQVCGKTRDLLIDGKCYRALGPAPVKFEVNGRVHTFKFVQNPIGFSLRNMDEVDVEFG